MRGTREIPTLTAQRKMNKDEREQDFIVLALRRANK